MADARESENTGSMETCMPHTDPAKKGLYDAKHQGMALTTDAAGDGPVKAEKMAETVGDTAKGTMDGAWKAGVDGVKQVKGHGREEQRPSKKRLSADDIGSNEDLRRPECKRV